MLKRKTSFIGNLNVGVSIGSPHHGPAVHRLLNEARDIRCIEHPVVEFNGESG